MIKLRELLEPTITLYHATRKPLGILKNGIKVSNAGVIKKEGVSKVYAANNPSKAVSALEYEEDLKLKLGIPIEKRGDIMVIQFSVPIGDVVKKPNGDFTLDRDVRIDELDKILTKMGMYINY